MDRNLEPCRRAGKGAVVLEFSFLTNGTSAPLTSTLRGLSTDWIATLGRTGVGILTVTLTLAARARYCIKKEVELDDLSAADDGAYATSGPVQNEGSSSLAMTFNVYTRAATGTKADFTGRRVNVCLVLKNSTVGV